MGVGPGVSPIIAMEELAAEVDSQAVRDRDAFGEIIDTTAACACAWGNEADGPDSVISGDLAFIAADQQGGHLHSHPFLGIVGCSHNSDGLLETDGCGVKEFLDRQALFRETLLVRVLEERVECFAVGFDAVGPEIHTHASARVL